MREISRDVAAPFIKQWHYSKKTPTGKNVFFGGFVDDTLYVVADYGIGVNQTQHEYLTKVSGCDVRRDNLYELKRLCRIEPKNDDVALSQFLAICHSRLRALGIDFIISFSDPTYSHTGKVYAASGFRHLGKTNAEWHVRDKNGVVHHRRVPYRLMQRHGKRGKEGMAWARDVLGLTPVQTLAKDRWFLPLRKKDKKVLDTKLSVVG